MRSTEEWVKILPRDIILDYMQCPKDEVAPNLEAYTITFCQACLLCLFNFIFRMAIKSRDLSRKGRKGTPGKIPEKRRNDLGRVACKHSLDRIPNEVLDEAFPKLPRELMNGNA
jgi:hypothetical protein